MPLKYTARFISAEGHIVTDTVTTSTFPLIKVSECTATGTKTPHLFLREPVLKAVTGETFKVATVCDQLTVCGRIYKVTQDSNFANTATPLHNLVNRGNVLAQALPSPIQTEYTISQDSTIFAGTPVSPPPIAAIAEAVAYIAHTFGAPHSATFYGAAKESISPSEAFAEYYAWSECGSPTTSLPTVAAQTDYGETTEFSCCTSGTYALVVHLTTDSSKNIAAPAQNTIVAQIVPTPCSFDKKWTKDSVWHSVLLHGGQFKVRFSPNAGLQQQTIGRANYPSASVWEIIPSKHTVKPLALTEVDATATAINHTRTNLITPPSKAQERPLINSVIATRPNIPL